MPARLIEASSARAVQVAIAKASKRTIAWFIASSSLAHSKHWHRQSFRAQPVPPTPKKREA
jgi:hypothetical protein